MIELMHGDCLELMKKIPDNSVDMCLTDPPYGTTACKWDTVIPFEPMWEQLHRVVKDNGAICLFGSEPFSSYLRLSNIKNFKYDWIWKKNRPANVANAKRQPLKFYELIHVFNSSGEFYFPIKEERLDRTGRMKHAHKYKTFRGSSRENAIGMNETEYKKTNELRFPSCIREIETIPNGKKTGKYHPTQKPVALLEYLIKTYTLETETVLDFTMGSGSTGVACKNLNRKFIGIEQDDKYFEVAKNRINGTEQVK